MFGSFLENQEFSLVIAVNCGMLEQSKLIIRNMTLYIISIPSKVMNVWVINNVGYAVLFYNNESRLRSSH